MLMCMSGRNQKVPAWQQGRTGAPCSCDSSAGINNDPWCRMTLHLRQDLLPANSTPVPEYNFCKTRAESGSIPFVSRGRAVIMSGVTEKALPTEKVLRARTLCIIEITSARPESSDCRSSDRPVNGSLPPSAVWTTWKQARCHCTLFCSPRDAPVQTGVGKQRSSGMGGQGPWRIPRSSSATSSSSSEVPGDMLPMLSSPSRLEGTGDHAAAPSEKRRGCTGVACSVRPAACASAWSQQDRHPTSSPPSDASSPPLSRFPPCANIFSIAPTRNR